MRFRDFRRIDRRPGEATDVPRRVHVCVVGILAPRPQPQAPVKPEEEEEDEETPLIPDELSEGGAVTRTTRMSIPSIKP
jgi:hypothetical protein